MVVLAVGLLLVSAQMRDDIPWVPCRRLRLGILRVWTSWKIDGWPIIAIIQHEFFPYQLSVLMEIPSLSQESLILWTDRYA